MNASKANERGKVNKEDFKDYICVICSTQNQMVNYIPIKEFGFKKIYTLTIEDSSYFMNKRWDDNLESVFGDKIIERVFFKQTSLSSLDNIKKEINDKILSKNEGKNIFWNVTGGQRPFLMAMNSIASNREKDCICYIEGNKSEIFLDIVNSDKSYEFFEHPVKIDLDIETALYLSGFENYKKEKSHHNILKDEDSNLSKHYENYRQMFKLLQDRKTSLEYRKLLLQTNITKREDLDLSKNENWQQEIIKNGYNCNSQAPMGTILEQFSAVVMKNLINEKFQEVVCDMALNYKINYSDKKLKDSSAVDELDIILLTRNGKFIVFECKSGHMDKEGGKSHKYTTYSVSGVFGTPILISPLFSDEIERNEWYLKQYFGDNVEKIKEEIAERKKALESEDEKLFKKLYQTAGYAKRANLEVWGIDEIESKLNELLNK